MRFWISYEHVIYVQCNLDPVFLAPAVDEFCLKTRIDSFSSNWERSDEVNNKDAKTMSLTSFWCLYCWLWTYFTPCSIVSIVTFEQVNAGWVVSGHETYNLA